MFKEVTKLSFILIIICGLATAFVSFAFDAASPLIAERRHKNIILGYTQVLPEAVNLETLPAEGQGIISEIVRSEKERSVNGYIYTVNPQGYSGQIVLMVGISHPAAQITGVKILQQTETPGLGSKCAEPDFIGQFTGKTLAQPLSVSKKAESPGEVQAITASTITSKAVVGGINAARQHYLQNFAVIK